MGTLVVYFAHRLNATHKRKRMSPSPRTKPGGGLPRGLETSTLREQALRRRCPPRKKCHIWYSLLPLASVAGFFPSWRWEDVEARIESAIRDSGGPRARCRIESTRILVKCPARYLFFLDHLSCSCEPARFHSSKVAFLSLPCTWDIMRFLQVVLVSLSATSAYAATATTTSARTSITGCHNHGSDIYCIDEDGEELQVSVTATPTTGIPAQYTGCHYHGTEL